MKKIVSGIMLALLITGVLVTFNTQSVKASGTIYIRADGSVDPPTAPISKDATTYTLTADIYDSIVIERDDITVDGGGYTLEGTGSGGTGIVLLDRSGVTVYNLIISGTFGTGIALFNSSGNTLQNNILIGDIGNVEGIFLGESNDNCICGNIVTNCPQGIVIGRSNANLILGNNVTNNGLGIFLVSSNYTEISTNIFRNNLECIVLEVSSWNNIYNNNFVDNEKPRVNYLSVNNFWDAGYPSGGNYWSDYTGVDEKSGSNQDQSGSDGFGDTPYIFVGGQDRYPFMKENGWDVPSPPPPNHPPNLPATLQQLKSDSVTEITVGGTTDERTVYFKGTVSDPDGDQVKLQVELRNINEYGGEFDETQGGLKDSELVESGSEAVAGAVELIDEDYHWRARTVDEHGEASEWVEFGGNDVSEVDFIVNTGEEPLPTWVEVNNPAGAYICSDLEHKQPYRDIPVNFIFQNNLKQGDSGDDVKYLQILLNANPATQVAVLGSGSSGYETNYFGPLTERAVENFQKLYELPVNGEVNDIDTKNVSIHVF